VTSDRDLKQSWGYPVEEMIGGMAFSDIRFDSWTSNWIRTTETYLNDERERLEEILAQS
jgi:hypothetical protein